MAPSQSSSAAAYLRRPVSGTGEYLNVTPADAGWQYLNFGARRLAEGERWIVATGANEMAIVVLGGVCCVQSTQGTWDQIGRRPDVFHGMPYTLYLPRETEFTLTALRGGCEVAYGACPADEAHPARLITPAEVLVSFRGGGNATRQVHSLIPVDFDCSRLVAIEAFVPSGNWSAYPPHKHDEHRVGADGALLEAKLEEVFFYKTDPPNGYAIQRIYTKDGRLNEAVVAHNDDVVLVTEGYHPVVSAHGYTTYFLNFLAGPVHSLANTEDPDYAWVASTWKEQDARVPLVTLAMEAQP